MVCIALAAVNAAVFIICMFGGTFLYDRGELGVLEVLWRKEYWRIVTAMFLHSSTQHLFSNMIMLLFMGAIIEKETGHFKFALLYFLSGIGGNVLSLLIRVLEGNPFYSLGASGAVFGLDGALLAMILFWNRKVLSVTPVKVLIIICLSIYSGFTGGNIDNAAHIGGLITGFATGGIFCLIQRAKRNAAQQSSVNEVIN